MAFSHQSGVKFKKAKGVTADVLHSHTPETAAQEVAALLMACSIMAEQRLTASRGGKLNPLNISFIKTLENMNSLWAILAVSEGLLD